MEQIRAASVQFEHLPGDKKANLKVIDGFAKAAAGQGVNLGFRDAATLVNILADAKPENVVAMYDAVRDFSA